MSSKSKVKYLCFLRLYKINEQKNTSFSDKLQHPTQKILKKHKNKQGTKYRTETGTPKIVQCHPFFFFFYILWLLSQELWTQDQWSEKRKNKEIIKVEGSLFSLLELLPFRDSKWLNSHNDMKLSSVMCLRNRLGKEDI